MLHLKHILLEDPCELAAVALVAHLALLFIWRRAESPAVRRWLLLGPAVALALFAVQALIVTDREEIQALLERSARAIERGRLAEIADAIDEEFVGNSLDKAGLLKAAQSMLGRYAIENARLDQFEIQVENSRARTSFRARCRVVSDVVMIPEYHSRWYIELVRRSDGFKIIRIPEYRLQDGRGRSLRELPQ